MKYSLENKIGHTYLTSAHQGFVQGRMRPNTLSAFYLAAVRGADMIETDARGSSDGVMMVCHDPVVCGFDVSGKPVEYDIAKTPAAILKKVIIAEDDYGVQYMPALEQVLSLCYRTGMLINIDLKNGAVFAETIAHMVRDLGMRGRCVYATNASGAATINKILDIDPCARFIDTPANYTADKLCSVPEFSRRCFAYTADFSEENISRIRESGCMLAAISISEETVRQAVRWHPEMLEYPHTSDFLTITTDILDAEPVI
ncbi:MAG: hypothetical protein K5663_03590 [Clostridiales bacterium]|nr:hypothetical protein [Clostridiales bacterium]